MDAPPCSAGPVAAPHARDFFTAHALTKTYRMGEVDVPALRNVDLSVRRGEFLVMLGPSGSGKSTLLNILGGLDVPSSGEVRYEGEPLHGASERALTQFRRRHVGFVFQFYNLLPSLTALENVLLVGQLAPSPLDAAEVLGHVGLADRLHHFPGQLSGGEQQRVAIARALVKRPDILLCDEPTGALDAVTGVRVLQALARANTEFGTTTVIITHNADIARMADRVIHLADGRIARDEANPVRVDATELHW